MDKEIHKQAAWKWREIDCKEVTQEDSQRSDPLSTVVKTFGSDVGVNILIMLLTQSWEASSEHDRTQRTGESSWKKKKSKMKDVIRESVK